jgi:hypothetical protein
MGGDRELHDQIAQIALGGEDMKPEIVLVAVIICLAMMSVTPAFTAPRHIEDLC